MTSLIASSTVSRSVEPCSALAHLPKKHSISSPHVVIRGETSTRIKPNTNFTQTTPQVAHIDWLAFSLTPPAEFAQTPIPWLLPQLRKIFGLPDFAAQSTGKGWNGYAHRVNLGDNAQYGLIAHGGENQRGSVHVELNATACAHVQSWDIVQQWGESLSSKITRVDLAHDDISAENVSIATACTWYQTGEFTSNGRPPTAKLIDDMGSGKGKTLYIGNRANGKLLRVYEKGRQLGDISSTWVRVELELRGKSRVLPWDVLTSPASYLAGGYPCLSYLSTVQDKIRTITKTVQITLQSILEYLRTTGGKAVNVLMQANGGDAFAIINAIKRDGIPRRLVNYSDFLPRILDGSEVLT